MPKTIDYAQVISQLRTFYTENKRLPSFAEMQSLLGYRSKGGVSRLIRNLLEKGILTRDGVGKLKAGNILSGGLRLLGTVQAGFPSPAEEEVLDTLSLDEYLIRRPQASYLVKVTGDSMIEAGIMPGDLVVVERGRQARVGDIIIAQVDGAWTLKYLDKKDGKNFLRSGNPEYPPIYPQKELLIGGVVVADIRRY